MDLLSSNLFFSAVSGPPGTRNANIRLAAPDAGTNFVRRPLRAASSASARSSACSPSASLRTPSPAVAARASLWGAGGLRKSARCRATSASVSPCDSIAARSASESASIALRITSTHGRTRSVRGPPLARRGPRSGVPGGLHGVHRDRPDGHRQVRARQGDRHPQGGPAAALLERMPDALRARPAHVLRHARRDSSARRRPAARASRATATRWTSAC